jgi:hypothetical protein
MAADPRADAERRRRRGGLSKHPLAAAPARGELDEVTSTHPSDPAPTQTLHFPIERHPEARIRHDDRGGRRRNEPRQSPQDAMRYLSTTEAALRVELLVQGQTLVG